MKYTNNNVLKHNLLQLLLAIDQLGNAVIGLVLFKKHYADETISSHSYRLSKVSKGWYYMKQLVDTLFWFDYEERDGVKVKHCQLSYESELERNHLPVEMR